MRENKYYRNIEKSEANLQGTMNTLCGEVQNVNFLLLFLRR